MFKNEKEALEALRSTISELEQLTKSWDAEALKKSEGAEEMAMSEDDEPAAEPAGDASGGEGAPDAAAPAGEPDGDEGPAPEAPSDGDGDEGAPAEGGEGDDIMAQIAAESANLSDDELHMLLHALMEEMDSRHAEAAPEAPAGDEGAPAPGGDMGPEETDKSLAMSMKQEFKKLTKSLQSELEGLRKSVDTLKQENAALKVAVTKPAAKTVVKAAPTNKVEVLEKSEKQVEKLSKSEIVTHLMGEIRKGNRNVKADDVALVNAVRNDDDMNYALDVLKNKGVEIPSKK